MIRYRANQAQVTLPSIHPFRRWFALTCLRAGANVYSIQELMGHADLQVLIRYLKQTSLDLMKEHHRASPVDNLE
jgi:integrase/recombinase XerD